MLLERKRESELIPQYSLTGDLLSFLRCGLQYRYHNGSALPPSRPVQLWFGEFIHGVMENAYRLWKAQAPPFPWPSTPTESSELAPGGRLAHDIGTLGDVVEATLRTQGKLPRSADARRAAYRRVERAVNKLGVHLFPLVEAAEQKVLGTRTIPTVAGRGEGRAQRYELHGIIDVLTDVQLTGAPSDNAICQALQAACADLQGRFEVIVDYKGSRRPPMDHAYWRQGDWQLKTYAWLRTRQPRSLPVVAGILLYVNELAPGTEDLRELHKELQEGRTDVAPVRGSLDERQLSAWRPENAPPDFSLEYRLRRAIRIVPISPEGQEEAATKFDRVVLDIEGCVHQEAASGGILGNWAPCGDEGTCGACDFRHFCPRPFSSREKGGYTPPAPAAP